MFGDIQGWFGNQNPADRNDAAIRRHLRKLRSDAGMTQEQVARAMNMERSVYSKYETGKLRLNEDFLGRFARLFQTTANALKQEAAAESPENQSAEQQSEELRQLLGITFSTERPDFLPRSPRFIGRKWLVQEVESWLDNPDGPQLMVLYGDPGIGKTSFSARLVHSSTRIPGCLFCDAQDPRFRDPRIFIHTLAWLLACSLPDYRLSLVSALADCRHPENLSTRELRELLIETPMRDQLLFDDSMEILCVVVDGIDAVSPEETSEMALLLAETARKLPKWVRILVTSRETDSVKAALADFSCLNLQGTEERNLADVKEYFTAVLKKQSSGIPDWDAALENLLQRSGGIFLYAQAMCESILSGRMSIRSLDSLPEGLPPVFHRWFADLFPDEAEYRTLWGPGLSIILVSPEPIPREELRRTLEWTEEQERVFFRRMNLLLRADTRIFGMETVEIAEPFLRQWLTGAARDRDIYEVSLSDALSRMADAFFARMKQGEEAMTAYEALHLQEFLEKTGRMEQLEEARNSGTLAERLLTAGDEEQTDDAISDRCYTLCQKICMRLLRKSDHARLRHLLSMALFQLGQNRHIRGDLDGAISDYMDALKQEQKVLKQEPDRTIVRSHILLCCWKAAAALTGKKKLRAALKYCDLGLKTAETQIRNDGSLKQKWMLCKTYQQKGRILKELHRKDAALTTYEKGVSLASETWKTDPEFMPKDQYGSLLWTAAGLNSKMGNPRRARELYLATAEVHEQMLQENPQDRDLLDDLSRIYIQVSKIMDSLGLSEEEENCAHRIAELAEQMMMTGYPDEDDETSCSLMMLEYGPRAGELELAQGNRDRARKFFELAIVGLTFLRWTGDCFAWNSLESFICISIAEIQMEEDDWDGAMEKLLRSKELLERAEIQLQEIEQKHGPNSATRERLENQMKETYTKICQLLQEKRSPLSDDEDDDLGPEPELHLDVLNRMLPLLEKEMADHPEDDNPRILTALVLYHLKPFLVTNHEDDRLQENADRILALMERDVSDPEEQNNRTLLQGYAYQMKAEVEVRRGNREEAIHLFRQAEETHRQHFEQTGTADWSALCTVCRGLGDLLRELRRYDEAMEKYRACIRMAEEYFSPEFLFLNVTRFDEFICESWVWISVCLRAVGDPEGALECCKTLRERILSNVQTECPCFDELRDDKEHQVWDRQHRFACTLVLTGKTSSLLRESGDPEGAALFDLETDVFADWDWDSLKDSAAETLVSQILDAHDSGCP